MRYARNRQPQRRNTSSTHTIYVTKVETNATGGLVGGVRRFADGGAAAPAFPG